MMTVSLRFFVEHKIVNLTDFQLSAIIIGFEETTYTVSESIGTVDVFVSVINPPTGVEFFAEVNLVIQSVGGNASK